VPSSVEAEYKHAVQQAVIETGLPKSAFPVIVPYTERQLLDFNFIP